LKIRASGLLADGNESYAMLRNGIGRPRHIAPHGGRFWYGDNRSASVTNRAPSSTAALSTPRLEGGHWDHHQVEPDPAEIAERHGAETTVLDWRDRLMCSQCGG